MKLSFRFNAHDPKISFAIINYQILSIFSKQICNRNVNLPKPDVPVECLTKYL